jgi:hypothetical protein
VQQPDRVQNPGPVAGGQVRPPTQLGTDRQHDGVDALLGPDGGQVLDGRVAVQVDAGGEDPVDLAVQHLDGQSVARDAVAQHAARQRLGLAHRDLVPELAQVVGGGQPARPRADDDDVPAGVRRGLRQRPAPLQREVAEEALDSVDPDGLVDCPRLHTVWHGGSRPGPSRRATGWQAPAGARRARTRRPGCRAAAADVLAAGQACAQGGCRSVQTGRWVRQDRCGSPGCRRSQRERERDLRHGRAFLLAVEPVAGDRAVRLALDPVQHLVLAYRVEQVGEAALALQVRRHGLATPDRRGATTSPSSASKSGNRPVAPACRASSTVSSVGVPQPSGARDQHVQVARAAHGHRHG